MSITIHGLFQSMFCVSSYRFRQFSALVMYKHAVRAYIIRMEIRYFEVVCGFWLRNYFYPFLLYYTTPSVR